MTKAEDRLTTAIHHGFRSAQALYTRPQLVAFLQAGLAHAPHFTAGQRERLQQSIRQGYRYALLAGARGADLPVAKLDATVDARFDVTNPSALRWVERHAAELVDLLDVSQRLAVQAVIRRMFVEHVPVDRAARLIFELIGLDERYANAVAAFEAELQAEGDRAPEQIQRLVSTYSDRLRRFRARMIARTESIRASTRGQQMLWAKAVEEGILNPARTRQVWLTALDERACPICLAMHHQQVPLGEPFIGPDGATYDGPPDPHPQCRCGVRLVFMNAQGEFPAPPPTPGFIGGPEPQRSLRPHVPQQVVA